MPFPYCPANYWPPHVRTVTTLHAGPLTFKTHGQGASSLRRVVPFRAHLALDPREYPTDTVLVGEAEAEPVEPLAR